MVLESETANFEPGYCFLRFILPLVSYIISYAVIVQCHIGSKQMVHSLCSFPHIVVKKINNLLVCFRCRDSYSPRHSN